MLKKSLAIILSTALALGILVQGSFAFATWGSDGDWKTITNANSSTISTIESDIETYNYQYAFLAEIASGGTFHLYLSDYPMRLCTQSSYGIEIPNSSAKCCRYIIYNGSITGFTLRTSPDYTINNIYGTWYYYFRDTWSVGTTGTGWASYDFDVDVNYRFPNPTTYSANLSGFPWQDTRTLEVYRTEYAYLPYLAIRTDDVPTSSNSWVSIRYHDIFPDGSSHIGTAIFDYDDYSNMILQGDDYDTILISPLDISPYQLFVQSVLYSGSTSWGFKELELEESIAFNPALYPSPIPSVTPVPDYYYYDTTYINYNGGNKDVFFNSYSVVIDLYGSVSGGLVSSPYYFTDNDGYLEQPFAYSFIMLPSYISSNGFTYDGFIDDSFIQYDIILDKVPNSFWITSYGGSAYSDLQSGLSQFSTGDDVSLFLENFFSSHPPAIYTYPYGNVSLSFIDHYNCTLTITDSFYFKQTNFLLGDSGDILSEFSERFFKLNGFSDSLFSNLSALYNLDLLFYNDVSNSLTELAYRINGLDINVSFDSVINLLTSVDSYISSVDSKLNYLSTIDSDLNDLLEWFHNQDDSDVVLTLPDFNSTILIELYGENIGDLVDFFNDFVVVLPSFDFSDFPNFFSKSNDIVTDVADNNDDIIDNLFQPYNYSDDALSTFGWD